MISVRRSADRGHADRGWLDSRFTFSFADYYDPAHMSFGFLRVMNEDWVQPGMGFPTHPHRNMEIITYVLEGAVAHKDSTGSGEVLRPGEVQYMSAGRGIQHSEFNPSADEVLHLYQIWLLPRETGGDPAYDQRYFAPERRAGQLCPVATADGRDGSIAVKQDASVYATTLTDGATVSLSTTLTRKIWVQVARGNAIVNGEAVTEGDGAAIDEVDQVTLVGSTNGAELLVFEMGK
ncbi:MAG TPA: pirin family protein [Capsulimonadaceae bacterium]